MSSNLNRDILKALSQPFAILKKQGAIETINEGLVNMYAQQGYKELKSLREWNKLGRSVKKGEKALLLWGSPRQKRKEEVKEPVQIGADDSTEHELDFYPIAYLFDFTQTKQQNA